MHNLVCSFPNLEQSVVSCWVANYLLLDMLSQFLKEAGQIFHIPFLFENFTD